MSIDDLAEPNGRSPNIKEAAVPPNVARKDKSKSIIGFAPATLISTSEADMTAIHNQHRQSLKPRGPIEETFVEMLSRTARDIRRLCKYKESLLRNEMHPALKAIVEYIVAESDLPSIRKQKRPRELTAGWFRNKGDQADVAKILAQFNLDANSIEAEAWRRLSRDLDLIERQLASLEHRYMKQLKALADYRDVLVHRLKLKVQPILNAEEPFTDPSYVADTLPANYSQLS